MTWVSERSGSASSCDRCALQTPHPASPPASRKTMNRFRDAASMIRSITPGAGAGSMDMAGSLSAAGPEPALGVEQELGPGGDALSGRHAGLHLVAAADERPELELARLQVLGGLSVRHEGDGPGPGADDGALRDGQAPTHRQLHLHRGEGARQVPAVPVLQLEADLPGASRLVER